MLSFFYRLFSFAWLLRHTLQNTQTKQSSTNLNLCELTYSAVNTAVPVREAVAGCSAVSTQIHKTPKVTQHDTTQHDTTRHDTATTDDTTTKGIQAPQTEDGHLTFH